MAFFKYLPTANIARPISAREADRECSHTDAGVYPSKRDFVVEARTQCAALEGAQRWVASWADDEESCVPDDLMLVERQGRKRYMILRVL